MKNNWKFSNNEIDLKDQFLDLERATREILFGRGITNEQQKKLFLSPDFGESLHDPFEMSEMDKAVDLLQEAKEKCLKVCVYGDYDADGVTSSVLLCDFFDQIGIDNFCYIPDRNKEGYSLNKKAVDYILSEGADLIISVDCGVSSVEEVEYAKSAGVYFVILDHHEVGKKLPNADAVVNPKKKGDRYPEKNLAGVGVAFKFIQALAGRLEDYDIQQLKWFLDLVAIGTVADCMALVGENRILVKFGLIVLSKTRRTGLKQLFHVGSIPIDSHSIPDSRQIGFQIGPRINAAGRMDHASIAFDLLSTKENEESRARILALELEDKNKRRQKVTEEIVKEVRGRVEKRKVPPTIVIEASPNWEIGVVGLAAGKIADKFNTPTMLFQEKEGMLHGSGRSVDDINLLQVVEKGEGLMVQYGGHAQALGAKLKKENFSNFKKCLEEEMKGVEHEQEGKVVEIDVELELDKINRKLIKELNLLEPFGMKNEEPKFLSRRVLVKDLRVVGNGEKHLKLWLANDKGEDVLECIGFGMAKENRDLNVGDKVNVVYTLKEDNWNGSQKIQGMLVDLEKI